MAQENSYLQKASLDVIFSFPDFRPQHFCTQYYHYTFAKGKEGIVHGKELEFLMSKTTDFLDRNEGTSILEPYYHACGHLYETGKIDSVFFMIARSITAGMLRQHHSNLWALCLTPHGCSTFMKERYAPNDGWIISFQSLALLDLQSVFPKEYGRFESIQIQYSFNEMQRLMEDILKKSYDAYKKDLALKIQNAKKELLNWLLRVLYYYGLRYKASEYEHEGELRLLFTLESTFSDWTSEDGRLRVFFSKKGKKDVLHLVLGSPYFYQATQEMSLYNDERLNSPSLTSETIQKVLSEKK